MRVWNITHLTSSPKYIVISGKRCSPGKSIEVESITAKERNLVGSYLYLGDFLPFIPQERKDALSLVECREYLEGKELDYLLSLTGHISPSLGDNLSSKSKFWLSAKISNAIFSDSYEVSPEKFLWTNHWVKSGSGYRKA